MALLQGGAQAVEVQPHARAHRLGRQRLPQLCAVLDVRHGVRGVSAGRVWRAAEPAGGPVLRQEHPQQEGEEDRERHRAQGAHGDAPPLGGGERRPRRLGIGAGAVDHRSLGLTDRLGRPDGFDVAAAGRAGGAARVADASVEARIILHEHCTACGDRRQNELGRPPSAGAWCPTDSALCHLRV